MTKVLREIIYFDRTRIESYISQLAGGVPVENTEAGTTRKAGSGEVAVDVKVVKATLTRGGHRDTSTETKTLPVHAALSHLEQLLEENRLVVDASKGNVRPGEIGQLRADATFESWGMLAALSDTVQGILKLAAKAFANDVSDVRGQHDALLKRIKRSQGNPNPEDLELLPKLSKAKALKEGLRAAADGAYVDDAKALVKLFFQDQNHIRMTSQGKTFVGLLRRDALVGSTMEEVLFDYGAKPSLAFGALFYVAEFGREEELAMDQLTARFDALAGQAMSIGYLQQIIREVGTVILDVAEELRRPIGEKAAFVIPLALYREIRPRD